MLVGEDRDDVVGVGLILGVLGFVAEVLDRVVDAAQLRGVRVGPAVDHRDRPPDLFRPWARNSSIPAGPVYHCEAIAESA